MKMFIVIKKCRLNLKTTKKFKSWLAGLIDGEGSLCLTPRIRIALQEKDKFVLKLIQETIGGNLHYRKKLKSWKSNWKPQWEWEITSKLDCLKFSQWIITDLVLKKGDAKRLIIRLTKHIPKRYMA